MSGEGQYNLPLTARPTHELLKDRANMAAKEHFEALVAGDMEGAAAALERFHEANRHLPRPSNQSTPTPPVTPSPVARQWWRDSDDAA